MFYLNISSKVKNEDVNKNNFLFIFKDIYDFPFPATSFCLIPIATQRYTHIFASKRENVNYNAHKVRRNSEGYKNLPEVTCGADKGHQAMVTFMSVSSSIEAGLYRLLLGFKT